MFKQYNQSSNVQISFKVLLMKRGVA